MKSILLLIVASLLSVGRVHAQRDVVGQPVEWFGTSSVVKLHKHFGLFFDGQFRFVKGLDNMQHMVRLSTDIYVNKHLSVSPFGYARIWNYQYGEQPAAVINHEHRFYQQIQYKHTIGKVTLTHRLRTEERFIQTHHEEPPGSGDFVDDGYSQNKQFRIRYRLWANYPLNAEKMQPKTFYLAAFVEAFMSWGELVTYKNKIDQYRPFVGLGYEFNELVNLQAGPMYQYLVKRNGLQQENNWGFYVQLNYNFDLIAKETAK